MGPAADGEFADAEGGLTRGDGGALAVFAAGADDEAEITADYLDGGEHVGTIADERGASNGRFGPAVVDPIPLAHFKHEIAV